VFSIEVTSIVGPLKTNLVLVQARAKVPSASVGTDKNSPRRNGCTRYGFPGCVFVHSELKSEVGEEWWREEGETSMLWAIRVIDNDNQSGEAR
jgi:hypothetical protein